MHLKTCSIIILSMLIFRCHQTFGSQVNDNDTIIYFAIEEVGSDNEVKAQCGNSFFVTNCGIEQSREGTSYDYWDSYPTNDYTCTCHGDSGSLCYATCVEKSSLTDYYRATTENVQGGTVYCPIYSHVLGCGIEDYQSGYEKYKSFYPVTTTGGLSGCYCYDYYGVSCYALCASNVENLTIYQSSDTQFVSSTCNGEEYGFGCGYKSIYMSSEYVEKYPMSYPSDLTQCTAYNYYGATSYIVCGDLAESRVKKQKKKRKNE